jgi:hypothetical protein
MGESVVPLEPGKAKVKQFKDEPSALGGGLKRWQGL